jgi:hypothetical protein
MTTLMSGGPHPSHPRPHRRARALAVALTVCVDGAAVALIASRHLPAAIAGAGLAGLGWVAAERLPRRETPVTDGDGLSRPIPPVTRASGR